MQNFDLFVYQKSKNKLIEFKKRYKKTYAEQILSLMTYYRSLPVEELANIIFENHKENNMNCVKSIITIKLEKIENHLDYFRKIHTAVITRIPNLEFRQMLLLLIHDYTKNEYHL